MLEESERLKRVEAELTNQRKGKWQCTMCKTYNDEKSKIQCNVCNTKKENSSSYWSTGIFGGGSSSSSYSYWNYSSSDYHYHPTLPSNGVSISPLTAHNNFYNKTSAPRNEYPQKVDKIYPNVVKATSLSPIVATSYYRCFNCQVALKDKKVCENCLRRLR